MYYTKPEHAHLWDGLMTSWLLALESERKAPDTVANYSWAPIRLAEWLHEQGLNDDLQALTGEQIRGWLADMAKDRSEATCQSRYAGLRQFIKWCLAEGEIDSNPMANVTRPTVRDKAVPLVPDDAIKALLASCSSRSFVDLRDRAMMLFLLDTGVRRGGLASMTVAGTDLRQRTAFITTKGANELTVPFGSAVATALDRYLRARNRENYSDRDWFWLGATGKGRLTGNGAYQALRKRGARIGLDVHPHMFRHSFAHNWLAAGGSEGDLMELAGWKSRQMVDRYAKVTRAERARQAHRKLSHGDTL